MKTPTRRAWEGALHVQRPDLRVRIVVLDRDRARSQRQEHRHRDQWRAELAGEPAPAANPRAQDAATIAAPTATGHPQRVAPVAWRDPAYHAKYAAQVGHHRPPGGRGPGGQLASPARQRGHLYQVGGAAAALPRSTQAATPATNGANASRACCWSIVPRRFHHGGRAMLGR